MADHGPYCHDCDHRLAPGEFLPHANAGHAITG